MLLKYSQAQKRIKATGIGKPLRTAGGMVKLASGLMTVVPKLHRRVVKVANKRPTTIHRTAVAAVKREQIPVDPCDNSNDSGLGFDHHLDYPHHSSLATHSGVETSWPGEEPPEVKRRRLEIKLESDDANDNFSFQEAVRQQTICVPVRRLGRAAAPLTLNSQLLSTSHDGLIQLLIVCQPEQQHRARYQTEGSRGAVKDRTGNGFPVVKLVGYNRPATLQVFIGTDQGKVAPHMFYQACRVSGKNSTPCIEKKIDGTIVIEVDIEPSKDMVVTCDCVGILKERNVDVEHRFPEEGSGRSKKKSTRCRMVFRTTVTHSDGSQETLQVTSQPIVCTQPPGVPEICKKSLSSCGARGGQELFILGKNFLKDTKVVFQEGDSASPAWAQAVQPDKEFLQQSHLVCVVPPYRAADISEPVTVRLVVESSGKASEPHAFLYLPEGMHASEPVSVLAQDGNMLDSSVSSQGGRTGLFSPSLPVAAPLLMPSESSAPFLPAQTYTGKDEKVHPVMMWNKTPDAMMPPPPPGLLPIAMRRSSVQMIVPDPLVPEDLKQEVPETIADPAKPLTDELPSTQASSMDTFHRYVTNNSLPSINVGNYLSNIEGNTIYPNKVIKTSPVISEMPRIMIPSPTSLNKPMFSGDSSNLLTTVDPVLANQSATMSFESRTISSNSPLNQSSPENLSVIVNSSVIPKKTPDSLLGQDLQSHKEITATENMGGLNILMSPTKRNPSATERLDAFVNSAAESHISPTPSSPIMSSVIDESSRISAINEMVMKGTSDLNKMQDNNVSADGQTTPLQTSQHSHQDVSTMNKGPLCSLLNSSVQTPQQTSNSSQNIASVQNNIEQQLNNQNMSNSQSDMSNLMHSPPQVPSNHLPQFSKLPSPMDQHLSPHALTSSQMSSAEINSIMQSSQQSCSNQSMAGFQTSLEHQLSPQRTMNSPQINHADLNKLIQTSSQSSSNEVQELTNIQASLEQQLSSQTLNSNQMSHCDMNDTVALIQTSPCNSSNEVQVMSNLQASLEQMSNQTVTSGQILHSEPIQSNNMGMGSMSGSLETTPHSTSSEVQSLCSLQASLEHHLSSQGINAVQNNHESMTNNGITLDTLNTSVPTSQIQVAVSQAQALSNLQASIRHLSSQVLGSATSKLNSTPHSTNRMNSSVETSLDSVNQNQNLTNLQMSFGHVASQVLSSNQQNHNSMTTMSMPLNSPIQTSPQHHATVAESQVFSELQASFDHHLNSNVVGSVRTSQAATPLERLANPLQLSSEPSSSPTLPRMQSSMNHISSNLISSPSNHAEALAANSLSIDDSQIIDLRSSVPLMTSQTMNAVSNTGSASSPNIMSPPSSRHSPSSVLTSPGISMSGSPTMALSPTNLANSQAMDNGARNIILSSPQPILTSELTINNPSTISMAPGSMRLQESQNVSIQSSAMTQFDQVTQSVPIQVSSMTHYGQHQEIASSNKEVERKESRVFMIPSGSVINRQQTSEQTVKKCEEGMPLPHELTQMSEHDLISYINPSCFDTV